MSARIFVSLFVDQCIRSQCVAPALGGDGACLAVAKLSAQLLRDE